MKMHDRKANNANPVQVAPGDLITSRVCVVACEGSLSEFLSSRFLTKANVKVVDGSSVKGKNEKNQQAFSGNRPPPLLPERRRGVIYEEDSLSLPLCHERFIFT